MKSRNKSERIAIETLFSKFENTADDPIEIGFHENFQNVDIDSEDTKSDMKITSHKKQKKAKQKDDQSDFEDTYLQTKISPVKKQKKAKLKDGHVGKANKRNDDQSGKEIVLLKEQKKRKGRKQDMGKVKDAKLGIKRKRENTKIGIVKGEKNKRKVMQENKWFGIRTRSSPKQLFKAITLLKKKQREAVISMGFGKLLSFKVDGIPAKLGHYVVDMFDEEKMEIRLSNGTIKVDSESVHQLLGIPNSGIDLKSRNQTKELEPTIACWRNMYENDYIGPPEIVTRIAESEDDDNFFFRLDFIVLFLSTMVECHTHGKCKLDILHSLSGDTDFSDIDWCGYVVNSMKKCKVGWNRCSTKSPFRGALTILTLLYVDSVACPGINVERTVRAVDFWTMERLKLRETLEIKNGGFGLGEFRGLFVDTIYSDMEEVEAKEDLNIDRDSDDLVAQISKLEKIFDLIVRNNSRFEKELGSLYRKNPENQEVKMLVDKYESIFRETPKWAQSCIEEADKRANVPDTIIAIFNGPTEDYDKGARIKDVLDKLNTDDEGMNTNVLNQLNAGDEGPLKNVNETSIPRFSPGLTQESKSLKESAFEKPSYRSSGCLDAGEEVVDMMF